MALLTVLFLPAMRPGGAATSASARSPDQRSETAESGIHPLALKEEMIRDRFERFEDRVYRLREQLGDQEPANAARLGRVLQRTGELGLNERLETLMVLLKNPSSRNEALDAQAAWLADADRLLAILTERDSDNEERQRDIDRLEEYRKKVAKILEQERALRDATAKEGAAQRMIDQLNQAIQRVDALSRRQERLAEQANPQKSAGAESQPSTGELGEGQTGQSNPQKSAGAESQPSTGELGERQTDLSGDTKQLAKDMERLADLESNADADPPEMESARKDTKAAGEALSDGAGAMSQAGGQLKAGDAGSAGKQQEQASEALSEARERLEAAKRSLEQQTQTDQLAEQQKQVAQETGDLSDKMQSDAAADGAQGQQGQQGGQQGSSSSSSPGQQSVEQAQQEMNDAAQSLGQSKTDDAAQSEDQAIDQLEQAQKELEDALIQLRQEEREETLRDLEVRFRAMLSKQRAINDATLQLHQVGADNFKRAEHLELAELSTSERALAEDAAVCLHILEEDGTTIVFPRVMEQLAQDMGGVARRLAAYNVGTLTQTIEREIVDTLEQLLEALQRVQQENEQEGEPQQGEPGEAPLLPPSAELKLLRASQVRVNTRTTAIHSARVEQTDSKESLAQAFRAVAARQVDCATIAREMRDLQYQP